LNIKEDKTTRDWTIRVRNKFRWIHAIFGHSWS